MPQRLNVYSLIVCSALLLHGCGENTNIQNNSSNEENITTAADAARFLEQATWGPTEATILEVQKKGINKFLNEQFSVASSNLGFYPYIDANQNIGCPIGMTDRETCVRDNYSAFLLQLKFFQNALNGRDQLRQRIAFALSQILVVSAIKVNRSYALAPYHEILMKNAFGNFRDILSAITLSPAMGDYLDMVNNVKPDPVQGNAPNENYARELLQLFSVGLYNLNKDGTLKKDGAGRPIPTYSEDIIEGFSHTFTGWTYPVRPGNTSQTRNPSYYIGSMIAVPNNHDMDSKKLLDDFMLPAQQTIQKDLNDAITNIFNHPNVGPFICKQLIQHLVTSNPSSAYVSRITDVFDNNGQGIRGDLKAVVKAILLDKEARGDINTNPQFGKLREPVKFILGILRALGGQSDGVFLRIQSAELGQDVYSPPTVFSFYPPNFPLPGTNLVSPVSAIYSATNVLRRSNFVYTLVYTNNGIAPDTRVAKAIGTKINLSPLLRLANSPEKLLDQLNLIMLHSSMSRAMKNIIIQAINVVPASDTLNRVRTAIYLIATSPQYQVER